MHTRPDDSLFPQSTNTVHGGISLREAFACHVLAGLAVQFSDPAKAADAAVQFADALVTRLNRDPASRQEPAEDELIDLRL